MIKVDAFYNIIVKKMTTKEIMEKYCKKKAEKQKPASTKKIEPRQLQLQPNNPAMGFVPKSKQMGNLMDNSNAIGKNNLMMLTNKLITLNHLNIILTTLL